MRRIIPIMLRKENVMERKITRVCSSELGASGDGVAVVVVVVEEEEGDGAVVVEVMSLVAWLVIPVVAWLVMILSGDSTAGKDVEACPDAAGAE